MATRIKPKMDGDKKNKRLEVFKAVTECIRADLKIIDVRERTHVHLVAVDRRAEHNAPISLPCEHCHCVSGYAYDGKSDAVWINGVDHRDLGVVDYGVQVMLENTGSWRTYLPLSVSALEKVMSPGQIRSVAEFKERYPANSHDLHFVQMISCR